MESQKGLFEIFNKMITSEQLKAIMPFAQQQRIDLFLEPLIETMREFEINTRFRVCAFVAQVAHESGSLNYVKELAPGTEYEGRKDLGNTQAGDGVKFKGRGLIQNTGRVNYEALSKAFGMDFISKPELLQEPEYAAKAAGWFWKTHGLNELADLPDFKTITKRINGGLTHFDERLEFYNKALTVIK